MALSQGLLNFRFKEHPCTVANSKRYAHHSRLCNHSVADTKPTPNNVTTKSIHLVDRSKPKSVIDIIKPSDDLTIVEF